MKTRVLIMCFAQDRIFAEQMSKLLTAHLLSVELDDQALGLACKEEISELPEFKKNDLNIVILSADAAEDGIVDSRFLFTLKSLPRERMMVLLRNRAGKKCLAWPALSDLPFIEDCDDTELISDLCAIRALRNSNRQARGVNGPPINYKLGAAALAALLVVMQLFILSQSRRAEGVIFRQERLHELFAEQAEKTLANLINIASNQTVLVDSATKSVEDFSRHLAAFEADWSRGGSSSSRGLPHLNPVDYKNDILGTRKKFEAKISLGEILNGRSTSGRWPTNWVQRIQTNHYQADWPEHPIKTGLQGLSSGLLSRTDIDWLIPAPLKDALISAVSVVENLPFSVTNNFANLNPIRVPNP